MTWLLVPLDHKGVKWHLICPVVRLQGFCQRRVQSETNCSQFLLLFYLCLGVLRRKKIFHNFKERYPVITALECEYNILFWRANFSVLVRCFNLSKSKQLSVKLLWCALQLSVRLSQQHYSSEVWPVANAVSVAWGDKKISQQNNHLRHYFVKD